MDRIGVRLVLLSGTILAFGGASAMSQSPETASVIVQPGAPGQASKVLPSTTRPSLANVSRKDVAFMQGMIHHHAQAVEMVELMAGRTDNPDLKLLGSRINHSQAEEMAFMRRWLLARGEKTTMEMPSAKKASNTHNHSAAHDHGAHGAPAHSAGHLMPGMLTPKQMEALRNASGREFDRLFLEGMIQHHTGALIMVRDLFESAGAGQDSEIFNFATEVDSGQRVEIRVMQQMLAKLPK
jgi:uncharacterized protein (DUF305 family)